MSSVCSTERSSFRGALELPEAERAGYLARVCEDDTSLKRRIEALLQADDELPDRFLETRDLPLLGPLEAGTSVLDDFEILGRLGEGGMGTVYVARQHSPRRDVALKMIRPERWSAEAQRRFRREIDVLGQLRHPGIAQIYQAGTAALEDVDGRRRELPFFVMELVRGHPLLEHARRYGLDLRARLELFVLVCDAVQHAHERGVVHRDLKSENVLVTEENTTQRRRADPARIGQPKILDFGIARSVGDASGLSEAGARDTRSGDVLGSLTSMSPEQARGEFETLDGRADVYALGVLLYQLLVERAPLSLAGLSLSQALHRIEHETPRSLGRIRAELRGDLSVIAARALEKDADRRYSSAADLAEDVRLHLAAEPIRARADSRLYVLSRELARHRRLVAGSLVLFLLLAAFAAISQRQARRNRTLALSESAAREEAEMALAAGLLERGRLLGKTGSPTGERILWGEYLEDRSSVAAHWALREFYATHPCLASREVHEGKIRALTLHPDDAWLASTADDRLILQMDADTLELGGPRIRAPELIRVLGFHPSGEELFGGGASGLMYAWNPTSGALLRTMDGHRATIRAQAFAPAGDWLVSLADDGALLRDATGRRVATLDDSPRGAIAAAFSSDGRWLALGGRSGLTLREAPFGGPAIALADEGNGHRGTVVGVVFSRSTDELYSLGADRQILAWDLSTQRARVIRADLGEVLGAWTSERAGELYVAGRWGLNLLETGRGQRLARFPLNDFSWGLDLLGTRLAIGDRGGVIRSWALERPDLVTLKGRSAAMQGRGADSRLFVADADGRGVNEVQVDRPPVGATGLDGELSVAEGVSDVDWMLADATRCFWSAAGQLVVRSLGEQRAELRIEGVLDRRAPVFDLSPDERRVVVAGSDQRFRVHSLEDGVELAAWETDGEDTYSVVWSPRGERVAAVARGEGDLRLHSARDGRLERRLRVEGERPLNAGFSHDGELLTVGTWERTVQVWDASSGALVGHFSGHDGSVWDAAFLGEQKDRLASLGADGTLRIWSLGLGRELASFALPHLEDASFFLSASDAHFAVTASGRSVLLLDLAALDRCLDGNIDYVRRRLEE